MIYLQMMHMTIHLTDILLSFNMLWGKKYDIHSLFFNMLFHGWTAEQKYYTTEGPSSEHYFKRIYNMTAKYVGF